MQLLIRILKLVFLVWAYVNFLAILLQSEAFVSYRYVNSAVPSIYCIYTEVWTAAETGERRREKRRGGEARLGMA